ncbi:MAG TPA: hypothetical protein VFF68_07850, partial [Anaerolineaceae bacterium]|nr:hypothetical protein [Anaerolineaceae bacterium]
MSKLPAWLIGMVVLLCLTACRGVSSTTDSIPETGEEAQPALGVSDQAFADQVVVDSVIVFGPAWLVIHAERSGQPAEIVGYTHLAQGDHRGLRVAIDPVRATDRLYAVLYSDRGRVGTFEFGDPDVPLEWNGQVVSRGFDLQEPDSAAAGEALPVEARVAMTGDRFDPARVTLAVGATVVWMNEDDEPHTVLAEDHSFSSGALEPGDEFEVTFS